jgi:hypothetical protein
MHDPLPKGTLQELYISVALKRHYVFVFIG